MIYFHFFFIINNIDSKCINGNKYHENMRKIGEKDNINHIFYVNPGTYHLISYFTKVEFKIVYFKMH